MKSGRSAGRCREEKPRQRAYLCGPRSGIGFFQVRTAVIGRGWSGFARRLGCGGRLRAAFAIGLFQITFERFLRAAGVVVGLLGLAVLVDRPLALAEQIED